MKYNMIYVSHLIWMLLKTLMKLMIYIFITLDLDVTKNTDEIYTICLHLI